MKRTTSPHLSALLLLASLTPACGSDDDSTSAGPRALPASAADAVTTYTQIVSASYGDTRDAAEALDQGLEALVEAPSAATLDAAQQAWLASREPYLQTEVYRFYDGPIDNPEDGPEGLLNAWPLDERHIDYVEGAQGTNIIGNANIAIDPAMLEVMNESPGEKDIATGYHAIEFLLWGQDMNPDGPGQRPFTDYVQGAEGTGGNQERRGEYLLAASELLLDNLSQLVDAWAPGAANYRAEFEALAPATALGRILSGMIILSGFETGGERLQAALDAQDQEDEHSCFSDNTHRDMIQDIQGVQNVWLGSYGAIAGTGLRDVVNETDPSVASSITNKIAESLSLAQAIQPPFDREIMAGNTAGNARVDALVVALFELRDELEGAFELYGLTRIVDPE